MVVLNRIYTRTGDDGSTALGNGERRPKYDLRVAAYGTVDEVNAVIGVARLHAAGDRAISTPCWHGSRTIFSISGPIFACPTRARVRAGRGSTSPTRRSSGSSKQIDRLNGELAPLRSFVLPGGSAAAAYLHLARTVCRRAERLIVELKSQPGETVTAAAIKYVNRLSDFFFVAARFTNDKGAADVLWVPGRNR